MTEEEKDIELIDNFLKENLSSAQQEEFEIRLKSDEAFSDLYHEIATISAGVKSNAKKQDLKFLQELDERTFPAEAKTVKLSGKFYLSVAAAVITLIVASILLFQNVKPTINEQLFSLYFEAPANVIIPTVRGKKPSLVTKEQAYSLYDQEKYKEAIPLLEQLPDSADDGASLFYLGISQLAMDRTEEGIKNLERYLVTNSLFASDANWYLFLGYVQNNQIEKANKQLTNLSQINDYRKNADDIIQKWEDKK